MDLLWDASLQLHESSTDVYKFLGSAKYEPVLQAIYAGLGIPQGITGGDSGMVKSALSLKTLMERLEYARNILIEFWEREFFLLQQAFGDRQPAKLRSDMMNLSDEAAANMIWVQLYDRNIITTETMREKFGLLPEVETQRQTRETKAVENGQAPGKIGPFTEAQVNPGQMVKTAMTQGLLAPSEAGVASKPKKKGDKSLLDHQERMADKAAKKAEETTTQKGQPGQGRPKGKPDQTKRKTRTPKVAARVQMQARETQKLIAEVVTPLFLQRCSKKNIRVLSANEYEELEHTKFNLLCSGVECSKEAILEAFESNIPKIPEAFDTLGTLTSQVFGDRPTRPTVEELRELHILTFVELNEDTNG